MNSPKTVNKKKQILVVLFRQLLYILGAFLIMLLQHKLANLFREITFAEFGCVENLQLLLLGACFITFSVSLKMNRKLSSFSLMLCSLTLLCICREMDNFFDKTIPVISWKIAFVFVFAGIAFLIKERRVFWDNIASILNMPAMYLMINAFFIILPCAQLIGHKPFLEHVLVTCENLGSIKELFEESAETLGYYVFLCAAIEWIIDLRSNTHTLNTSMIY